MRPRKTDTANLEADRKAAEAGDPEAQNRLGDNYYFGHGVGQDDDLAFVWYRKAAKQGNAVAQGNLGFMYEDGRGVEKDGAQAAAWYRKAAEQGDEVARKRIEAIAELAKD